MPNNHGFNTYKYAGGLNYTRVVEEKQITCFSPAASYDQRQSSARSSSFKLSTTTMTLLEISTEYVMDSSGDVGNMFDGLTCPTKGYN